MMKTWDRAERAVVGVLGLAALAIAVWQVLSRYFFPHQAISYAEEVMVYLLIWAIMIVSSQLVSTDSHIRPDVLRNVVRAGVARRLEIFNCAVAVAFCCALTWYGWQIVETAKVIDEHSPSDLQFPMWIYYLALPTGGALMAVRYVIRLIRVTGSSARSPMPSQHPGGHELPGLD